MRPFWILGIILIAGCDALGITSVSRHHGSIQTDAQEYSIEAQPPGRGFVVSFSYTNLKRDTVYIPNCREGFRIYLQRNIRGVWFNAFSPSVLDCLSEPIVIAPGATYDAQLHVWGAPAGTNIYPQLQDEDLDGIYRLMIPRVVTHYSNDDRNFGRVVPEDFRVSNAFRVVDP